MTSNATQSTPKNPLFPRLPNVTRLKKSLLIAIICLGCVFLFVIIHYVSLNNSSAALEDSLTNDQESQRWLSAHQAVTNNKLLAENHSANTPVEAPSELIITPNQEAQLEAALRVLNDKNKTHSITENSLSDEEKSNSSAADSPIEVPISTIDSDTANHQPSTKSADLASHKRLPAGTLIPIIIVTEINSELPGFVQAQVTRNVLNTAQQLIIRQGTHVLLHYDTVQTHVGRLGLKAVSLQSSTGPTCSLEDMPVVDQLGQMGIKDQTHHHYVSNFFSQVVNASVNAVPQLALSKLTTSASLPLMLPWASSSSETFAPQTTTFKVRMGYCCNILVVQDIPLPCF